MLNEKNKSMGQIVLRHAMKRNKFTFSFEIDEDAAASNDPLRFLTIRSVGLLAGIMVVLNKPVFVSLSSPKRLQLSTLPRGSTSCDESGISSHSIMCLFTWLKFYAKNLQCSNKVSSCDLVGK